MFVRMVCGCWGLVCKAGRGRRDGKLTADFTIEEECEVTSQWKRTNVTAQIDEVVFSPTLKCYYWLFSYAVCIGALCGKRKYTCYPRSLEEMWRGVKLEKGHEEKSELLVRCRGEISFGKERRVRKVSDHCIACALFCVDSLCCAHFSTWSTLESSLLLAWWSLHDSLLGGVSTRMEGSDLVWERRKVRR